MVNSFRNLLKNPTLCSFSESLGKLLDPGFRGNDDPKNYLILNVIPAKAGHEVKLFSAIQVKAH
jgi:hypothetical protein